MISSSIQATLAGRFGNSEYGRSKKDGEELFFDYAATTGAKVLVYRFPNLVGKWVRPNYNSAVGTFCNNIANDLEIKVNDPSVMMSLVYIDDVVDEFINIYNDIPARDFMHEYRENSMCIGKVVDYIEGGVVAGQIEILDVDDDGRLIALKDGKREVLDSGEISIKMK